MNIRQCSIVLFLNVRLVLSIKSDTTNLRRLKKSSKSSSIASSESLSATVSSSKGKKQSKISGSSSSATVSSVSQESSSKASKLAKSSNESSSKTSETVKIKSSKAGTSTVNDPLADGNSRSSESAQSDDSTASPVQSPTTLAPSASPTIAETTESPTMFPSDTTTAPSPSGSIGASTQVPSREPSVVSTTLAPTSAATIAPTPMMSVGASTEVPSTVPTNVQPSNAPTPTVSMGISELPSTVPTNVQSSNASTPTVSMGVSELPSSIPTNVPSLIVSMPSASPMAAATIAPVVAPTIAPTATPTVTPTASLTNAPVVAATIAPTQSPTATPTAAPTAPPTTVATVAPTTSPSTAPTTTAPTGSPIATPMNRGSWIEVDNGANLTARHEACAVLVGRNVYLLGGRYRGTNAVDIYNVVTRTWSEGAAPPIELHHMQCVEVDDLVWIVSSWTGNFPFESNTEFIYVYDPALDAWSTRAGLPEARRRGGAASIVVGRRIYVSHGNRGGHETADHAETLGWLDYYDIDADAWTTNLPDAPTPRDHTGGALINNRLCVAGGRDSGELDFFNNIVLPTDCFDLATETWSVEADIPVGRAGSSYGTTCDGQLMIAGGEGFGQAFADVHVFDGSFWSTADDLVVARHGSGLAVDCVCNQIHIPSGSGGQGGGPELTSIETLFPNGVDEACLA